MRIQLLSDLHLERNRDFIVKPVPGAEVLVLAGDVGSYQSGSRLPGRDFGLERFSTLGPNPGWPVVLYVPGNHEYDSLDFDATHERLRDTCRRLGITWLEREVVTLGRVRFVGTTLWSDFDALGNAMPVSQRLRQREKAFRAANYYLKKYAPLRGGEPMLAEAMRDQSLVCQAWLRDALRVPFDGSTVVVTHFAPSLRSADPRYGLTPGTAGFCNALDDLLSDAQLWLHGHLHCPSDYVVTTLRRGVEHRCRVVANPLGYADKGEQLGFREQLCIDIAG